MIGSFLYLTGRTLYHRTARQILRLQEPRYLIAILVGGLYLYYFLFRQHPDREGVALVTASWLPLVALAGLLFAVVRWWIFGSDRTALAFSPAEVQFLFPAPVSRRALLHWKLLRLQVVILINTLIWALLLRRGQAPAGVGYYLASIYVVFATLSLHRLGASLARAGLRQHAGSARAQLLPAALVLAACLVLTSGVARHWSALTAGFQNGDPGAGFDAVLSTPVVALVLWPFRALLAPVFATSHAGWLRAMGPAVAILGVHYLWVLRSDTAFEEAALAASVERARQLEAVRQGRRATPTRAPGTTRPAWFPLTPTGWPGTAFLWKNLVSTTRTLRPSVVVIPFIIAAVMVGTGSLFRTAGWTEAVGLLALGLAGMLAFFGPVWIRNDLRSDLGRLDLLRAYPLRGWTIAAGEIAASVILLTTLELGLLLLAFLASLGNPLSHFPLSQRIAALVLALGLLPALNAVILTLQNAAALLFPEWVNTWGMKAGGVETMGQNMVTMTLSLVLTFLALLVPLVAAGLVLGSLSPLVGPLAAIPASLAALAAVALELYLLLRYVGRLLERSDRS